KKKGLLACREHQDHSSNKKWLEKEKECSIQKKKMQCLRPSSFREDEHHTKTRNQMET
ncbi:hypothetical protein HMI54_013347, partial [Coelomomyces lativittatus]